MTGGFICKVKHPRNFGIALQIMAELKRSCGTISIADTQNLGHQQPPLDKNSMKLWLYTLLGSGYIEKVHSLTNGNCYALTSKGEDELRYHTSVERHKMFIQSMAYY
jgi:repressor of nif and glnA expression